MAIAALAIEFGSADNSIRVFNRRKNYYARKNC
jgi:hypothetical protein